MSGTLLIRNRVYQVVPNPGGPIGAGSVITLGLAFSSAHRTFLAAFGAGNPAYFILDDGAGKRLSCLVTVNSGGTVTINEVIGSPATETFASACIAWSAVPDSEMALQRYSQLAGFRNLLINGNPVINQRAYVSGTATGAANQYTLDRWRVVTSGQNASWTDSAGLRTVTAPAGGIEQVVEAPNNLGGFHTLSWTGNATATVNGSAIANKGTISLTPNTTVIVRFTGGTFTMAQLEPGPIATPFERRAAAAEMMLCQWYFERRNYANGSHLGAGALTTTINPLVITGLQIPFRPKRTAPAVSGSGAAGFTLNTVACNSMSFGSDTGGNVWILSAGVASGSVATPFTCVPVSTNTNVWIQADAEL
ncbi:hypothetical protein [Sediminicoccus sp. KRV36]|uniref:hypothetical protein n=1 Tax=Sediminicoccus sp. KRV36 TaxID=3133721 RepID=UPI00200CBC30|nr:hypothetical protein [Sediminicoccus rosea]UPY37226.1 hypothetical protein LHU95_00600 [Sediminicoccus rosea]